MTSTHDDALALLDRALGYTRGRLAVVAPHHLHRPTPCACWDLTDLLAHVDDALDAFLEAASGPVAVVPAPAPVLSTPTSIETLQCKVGTLLGAWLTGPPAAPHDRSVVCVGDTRLDAAVVVRAAALEMTLHGWDVGCATGERAGVPEALAVDLLDVARQLVPRDSRAPEFAPIWRVPDDATADRRLLAWTGRGTEPPDPITRVPPARHGGTS